MVMANSTSSPVQKSLDFNENNIKLANASGPVASAQVSLQISSTPPDAESQGSLMNITVSSSAHMYLVFGIVIAILAGLIYWGRGSLRK